MKKLNVLTESKLLSVIRRAINEMVTVEPYTLSAVGGKIKIKNNENNKTHIYRLEAIIPVVGRSEVNVDVIDEKGIKVSKVGITKFVKLDKPVVKKLISSNFGAPTLTMKKDDGEKVWFVKEL